jgi:hypothetical protein
MPSTIDFTAPSVDSNWHNIPRHQQQKRSKSIDVVAELAVPKKKKTANKGKGSSQEQQQRGNAFSMANRCHPGINFWPIFIETDSCASASIDGYGPEFNALAVTAILPALLLFLGLGGTLAYPY